MVDAGVTAEDKDAETFTISKRDVVRCFLFAKMVVIDEVMRLIIML
jgi:hypothetical protein